MISELKGECGHQYTSRLEGMFKDMDLSKNAMQNFKSFRAKGGRSGGPELSVTVLTTGFWPIPTVPKCILPKLATQLADEFAAFYVHKHSGRRLAWQTNLGTAEVRANFEGGKKDLLVHTYQMSILMLYNGSTSFTYAELKKATNIPDSELERHLLSLAHPKVRVLRKTPNNKTIGSEHVFAWNTQYTSKLKRIKIPLLSAKATEKKTTSGSGTPAESDLPDSVLEARKNRVEAALVRVMKARKVLEHNNLIAEVTKQLAPRFTVEPPFIKKRIESLIDREYIERDKENRRVYHYLA
eukprot:TRINITY_DN10166_c0_g1_i3.p1 TRINITY_DN10166_c0_g1~~TRINITY_DN10166_c0_g1_i3.p1  ORF type:complete len:346 (+),score=37.27 TRINITY_DN10166_c0_g1_i3:149-1039(+)